MRGTVLEKWLCKLDYNGCGPKPSVKALSG